jgi:hypothetical protein
MALGTAEKDTSTPPARPKPCGGEDWVNRPKLLGASVDATERPDLRAAFAELPVTAARQPRKASPIT